MYRLLLLVITLTTYPALAQKVDIASSSKQLTIDGKVLTKTSGITGVRAALGAESRSFSEEANPTRLYLYDELGFGFVADTVNNALLKLDITFKQDKKFQTSPKNSFNGTISLDGKAINVNDPIATVTTKTGIQFEQMDPFPCGIL